MSNTEMTNGQKKRLEKKQAAIAANQKKKFSNILTIAIPCVLLLLIAVIVIVSVSKKTPPLAINTNYSEGLTDEGRIAEVNASKLVSTIDPNNISVNYTDIAASDTDIQTAVNAFLDSIKYNSTDASLKIKNGDSINLDYVGTIDGVEFEGGSTKGNGADLTIGSGSFIDTFEEQLIGHAPGDEVTVNVTFPDPYANNADLAGKPAVFQCKINSIVIIPELTDELVVEKLSETYPGIKTVAEYKENVKKDLETSNLKDYIRKLVNNNSTASKIPSAYLATVKNVLYTTDLQNYTYYNNLYTQYLGYALYNSFEEYIQMSNEQYEEALTTNAKANITAQMAYELLFDKLGLSISAEEYSAFCSNIADDVEDTYGKGYIMMNLMNDKVVDVLAEKATIAK